MGRTGASEVATSGTDASVAKWAGVDGHTTSTESCEHGVVVDSGCAACEEEAGTFTDVKHAFDVVLVDVYSNGKLPPFFSSNPDADTLDNQADQPRLSPLHRFCSQLRRAVCSNGVVALNLPTESASAVQRVLVLVGFGSCCIAPCIGEQMENGKNGNGDGGVVVLAGPACASGMLHQTDTLAQAMGDVAKGL
jgi:hypothetical protein